MSIVTKIADGVSHVAWSETEPSHVNYPFVVTAGRADTDTIQCWFEGIGLPRPAPATGYIPPRMTYAQLEALFDTSEDEITYSARNTYNTFEADWATGYYMSMSDFIQNFYPNADEMWWSDFCILPDTKLTLSSGGYSITILASQIMDGSRYAYDAEEPVIVTPRNSGFLLIPGNPATMRFVIGQRAVTEQTAQMFVTLSDGGTVIKFDHSTTTPQFKEIVAFTNAIGANVTAGDVHPSGSASTVSAGTLVRFNIVQYSGGQVISAYDDYQSDARIYFTLDGTNPDPVTSKIVNLQAAQYTPGGINYPDGILLENSRETYVIKAMAYGEGANDSSVCTFTFTTT